MTPNSIFKPRPIADAVRSAFDDLNPRQIAIFARLTPARRAELMFEITEFARRLAFAGERARDPAASEEEIWKRVRRRIELGYDSQTLQRIRRYDHQDS